MNIKSWLNSFKELFLPRTCIICGRLLLGDELYLCIRCTLGMPRTNQHLIKDNYIEKMFYGKCMLGSATSFFYYHKGSIYSSLLYGFKYKGFYKLAYKLGQLMAVEINSNSSFFEKIDYILPVPLHQKRQEERGYNQSEWLAKGISSIVHIPISTNNLMRKVYTQTQTHKSTIARLENVSGIFQLQDSSVFEGKHILVLDDVLTTGATMTSCVDAFPKGTSCCFSFLSLAIASD